MPLKTIAPPVGSSSRFRLLRNVDFPEPEGPMTAMYIALIYIHSNTVQSLDSSALVIFFQISDLNHAISCLHGSFSFLHMRWLWMSETQTEIDRRCHQQWFDNDKGSASYRIYRGHDILYADRVCNR